MVGGGKKKTPRFSIFFLSCILFPSLSALSTFFLSTCQNPQVKKVFKIVHFYTKWKLTIYFHSLIQSYCVLCVTFSKGKSHKTCTSPKGTTILKNRRQKNKAENNEVSCFCSQSRFFVSHGVSHNLWQNLAISEGTVHTSVEGAALPHCHCTRNLTRPFSPPSLPPDTCCLLLINSHFSTITPRNTLISAAIWTPYNINTSNPHGANLLFLNKSLWKKC